MRPNYRRACQLLFVCVALQAAPMVRAETLALEAPRAVAALEQGLAAEQGIGLRRNARLAIRLYCDAAIMGSAEGFFRIGRVLLRGPVHLRNPALANAYFAQAAQLDHPAAPEYFDETIPFAPLERDCSGLEPGLAGEPFDIDGYLSALSPERRRVAELIRLHAARYGVEVRIALAIALAESNLDSQAVSPKNAQGVMQLIPVTQQRFGVKNPFDAESNIKGGLAYLKWLKLRFADDWELIVAAYNAGEGAVEKHGGIPRYRETEDYVKRVLLLAGFAARRGI